MIGFGNPLRGDDGIGPWLVEQALPRWLRAASGGARGPLGSPGLEGVVLRSVPQLLPELAVELVRVRRVLFVDAWLAPAGATARIAPLAPRQDWSGSHGLPPQGLLALAALLAEGLPPAEELLVPGWCWQPPGPGGGGSFSAPLRRQLPELRRLLLAWLQHA